jgi:hypothetical protein
MSEMDAKSIVIIGNGPSIANVDWHKLDDFATMGINGSFKLWNDIKWYPTYQYIARKHEKQWSAGLDEFMNTHMCMKIFYNSMVYPNFDGYGTNIMQPIKFRRFPDKSPDLNKWENPFLYDVGTALNMIAKVKGMDYVDTLVKNMPDDIDNKLNVYGIYKFLMGLSKNIRDTDYVTKPRYVPELTPPASFDYFYYEGGQSGETACWIAYLLGFTKMVLIGCDNNFVINKDGTMRQKASYGIKDMFYGMKYNTKEDIPCPTCRTTEGLRKAMIDNWAHLKCIRDTWKLDMEIINCSPVDNLDGTFPHKDPKEVLGVDIYKH